MIVFLVLLALVVYAVFWLVDRRNEVRGHAGGPDEHQLRRRGPLGPDDDEEFLRELERKRRHNQD